MLRKYKFQIVKPNIKQDNQYNYREKYKCMEKDCQAYTWDDKKWNHTALERVGERGIDEYDFANHSRFKYKGHWLCKHWFKILADVSVVFIRGDYDN